MLINRRTSLHTERESASAGSGIPGGLTDSGLCVRAGIVLVMVAIGIAAVGCRKIENPHPETRERDGLVWLNFKIHSGVTNDAHQHAAAAAAANSASFTSQTLRLLAPSNRIPPEVIKAFEDLTGASLRVREYDGGISNLEGRLRDSTQFDVLLLPGVAMQRLIEDQRILPLRHDLLPNLKGLEHFYRTNAFDPDQRYSVPYLWSTAGIVYNFRRLDFTPSTWGAMLFPPSNMVDILRGRISFLPDAALAISPALIYLGYSPNSSNITQLEEAGELLRQRHAELQYRWMAVPPATMLLSEEILMAQCFAGDIVPVIRREPRLLFAVPEDDTWIRIEFLTIMSPANERVVMLAHAFINFLLDSRVAGQVSSASFQATTIGPALSFVEAAVRNGGAYSRPRRPHLEKFDRASDLRRRSLLGDVTNRVPAQERDQ